MTDEYILERGLNSANLMVEEVCLKGERWRLPRLVFLAATALGQSSLRLASRVRQHESPRKQVQASEREWVLGQGSELECEWYLVQGLK